MVLNIRVYLIETHGNVFRLQKTILKQKRWCKGGTTRIGAMIGQVHV